MTVIDDAIAAKNEQGDVVAEVYCASCQDGKRYALGAVRQSSYGLVYDADLPGAVDHGPNSDEILRHRVEAAHAAGVRVPSVGAVGACIVLLEVNDPDQDAPEAECPKHGREKIAAGHLASVARHRRSSMPATVLIHSGGQ